MSSKRRRAQRGRSVSTGEMEFRPVKLTAQEQQEHADYAEMVRLMGTKRRPQDVPLFRKCYIINLNRRESDLEQRVHPLTALVTDPKLIEADQQRDLRAREALKHNDTVLYFAGGKFCDLIEATDNPDVTDLSVLRRIGNHTAMVLYERNIYTGYEGDALVAVTVTLLENMLDGIPRLLGSVIHEDNSISTFMYRFEELDEDLATVAWGTGVQERIESDITNEERLISNTLCLLAQQSVFTQTEWKHYPKAVATAAARERRKLPSVNVLGLTRHVQKDLDEHHEAARIERDFCWPVRGHFRKQAYGPDRSMRKLKFIRPHIKGNLEGPLIARPQVHAAK